jgi:hypothetical protein
MNQDKRLHTAKLDRSDVLQRTLAVLRKRFPTTLELAKATGSTRPSSDISDLRANGHTITSQYVGTVDGKRIFRYYLGR